MNPREESMKEDEMTKPIMSIKILEDFVTYTNAADDWITEYVPEAWEAREVLDYIAELEGENDQLTAHSDIERQDDKSPNDTQTQTIVYGKECK